MLLDKLQRRICDSWDWCRTLGYWCRANRRSHQHSCVCGNESTLTQVKPRINGAQKLGIRTSLGVWTLGAQTLVSRTLGNWALGNWALGHWVLINWLLRRWVLINWSLGHYTLGHWAFRHWVLRSWGLGHWALRHRSLGHWTFGNWVLALLLRRGRPLRCQILALCQRRLV